MAEAGGGNRFGRWEGSSTLEEKGTIREDSGKNMTNKLKYIYVDRFKG